MDEHVHLYCRSLLDFEFHEDKLVHENGCGNLRADVHTGNQKDFRADVKGVDEENDANVGPGSVKENITVGLKGTVVVVKLDEVVDWTHVGEYWLN